MLLARKFTANRNARTFVPGTYILNSDLPNGPLGTLVIAQVNGIEDTFTYQFPTPTPEPSSSLLFADRHRGRLGLVCFTAQEDRRVACASFPKGRPRKTCPR